MNQDSGPSAGRPIGFSLIALVLVVVIAIVLTFSLGNGLSDVKFKWLYALLSLMGVVFHIASKYREQRDGEGFSWKLYGGDYLFRALQALVYVTVIQNLGSLSSATWGMGLIALFVGMYIRRVEEAFDKLGDKFGSMLNSLLGSEVENLFPEERKKRVQDEQTRFLDLKKAFTGAQQQLDDATRRELQNQFIRVRSLLLGGKVDAADVQILNLDFRLKELGVQTPDTTDQ